MGRGIAKRLLRKGFDVYGYNRSYEAVKDLAKSGLTPCSAPEELVRAIKHPRVIWIMLPAGIPTDTTIRILSGIMEKGDCIIDGGNSDYRDSMTRYHNLQEKGIHFVDMGVSGGIWGEKEGYGLMFGAEKEVTEMILPLVHTLAPGEDKGWVHTGLPGSGHYVKMVHNAIEYGMMQAYAEGFELLKKKKEFGLDLATVSNAWKDGTVIRSWLLDLLAMYLVKDQELAEIIPKVADSGEARWALREAVDLDIPVPILANALFERFSSRNEEKYGDKILAIMRNAFGGHEIKKAD